MSKNVKSIFLVATLLFLLVGVSAISASEVSDDATIISDIDDTTAPETVTTTPEKIADTPAKNIKTEETTTDYYVSDTSGSDDNSGTNDSPLKTLQGALDKTTSEGTYNIHIAEGTYKGLGNTNLTINGDYNINLIGEGMNKTVFDGEAKYTIGGASAWGGDDYWNSYTYQNANYFLTITEGNGHITLSNFNIEHMASIGGTSIGAYAHATIDNYANLTVDNIFFYYNMAGVGSAIRNHRSGTVLMTNCLLTENRKSSSTGNDGVIYNNGTITIENTIFDHNAGRWGVILNDYKLIIRDSVMKNGIAYELGSTYKFGSGIASNSGQADFYNYYRVEDVESTIENVTFENNGQTDIYQGVGTLTVNNCNFLNSTGIYINHYVNHENNTPINMVINGSTFKDMKPSSYFGSLSVKTGTTFAIYSDGNYQLLIENNTIELPENGYGIYTSNNTIIKNNQLNSYIAINGNNNTITNNTINSTRQVYTVELSPNSQQNTITDNTLYSSILTGTNSIKNNTRNNIITDNTPDTGENILLTNENYNEYFDENWVNIPDKITNGSIIQIESLDDKKIILDNVKTVITTLSPEVNINNIQIQVNPTAKVYLYNLIINNDNLENILVLNSSYNTIKNVTIYSNTSNNLIVLEEDYNTLDTINIHTNATSNKSESIILLIKSSHNEIINPDIRIDNDGNMYQNITIIDIQNTNNNKIFEGKTYSLSVNKINCTVVNCENNNNTLLNIVIRMSNLKNINGFVVINSTNTTITNVGVEEPSLSSDETTNGVIIDSSFNTYITTRLTVGGNNTKGISIKNSNNTTITTEDNNIRIAMLSDNAKAIELENSNYTLVRLLYGFSNNKNDKEPLIDILNSNYNIIEGTNIKANDVSTVIKLTNSSNNRISSYITGDEEVKTTISTNKTILELNNSHNNNITKIEAMSGLNTIIITDSNNNIISNNNITSQNNYTILLNNSNNNNITNNEMNALNQTLIGDYTVIDNGIANIIENNTPGLYYITDENYDSLFTDSIFNHDYSCNIVISSDIHDKELIFPEQVTITNPEKYTLYNSTLTINGDNTIVNDLIFNNTNNPNTITINGDRSTFNNITIYHENDNSIRSIVNKANTITTFNNLNLTTIGAEIETNDNTPSIISIYSENKINLNNSNINTSYKSFDQKGTTNSITSQNINITNTTINTIGNNMAVGLNANGQASGNIYVTVKSNTTSIGTNGEITGYCPDAMLLVESNDTAIGQTNSNNQYGPITVLAENLAIGIYEVNDINLQIANYNYDIIVKSNNTAYGGYLKDSGTYLTQNSRFIYFYSNMNINGKDTTGIYAENINCPGLYISNNMTLNGSNVRGVYVNNMTSYNQIYLWKTNITITPENNTTPVSIKNVENKFSRAQLSISGTVINIKNYALTTPIISIENATAPRGVSITNNYLYSTGLCGENAIYINTSSTITRSNNTPTDINSLPVKFDITGLDMLYREANNITIKVLNYDDEVMNGTITVDFGPTEEKFENIILENGTANIIFTPNATEVLYQLINYPPSAYQPKDTTTLNVTVTYTTNTPSYLSPQNITKKNIRVYRNNITLTTNITGITHNPTTITTTVVDNFNRPVNEGIVKYVWGSTVYGQAPVINGVATTTITFNNTMNVQNFQSQYTGSEYIYDNKTLFGKCNIVEPELVVNPVTATAGETTTLSASITAFDETVTNINKGKVTFKVNGKTLKDASGKVIYAKVVNGVATIENYVVPEDWAKEGTTIEAIYSGSTQCEKLTSEKTNLTITPKELTLTTEDTTATIGSTTTLTATLSDNTINTGKIVFKINGKTVKDANGKVIYAKVVNGQVSVEYTIPENMKAKDYTLTATYISSDYRLEDTKTLTITA